MMLIHLKPLILSPITITIASCEWPVTSSHKMYFSEISKSMKTLIDIINISTGKWKQKERAREQKREHKREEEGEISSARTLMHCMPSQLSAVCQFLSSFAHAHAPYTRLFCKLLMCSAVHREARIHSILTLPSRAPILAQMRQPADLPQQRPRAFCN